MIGAGDILAKKFVVFEGHGLDAILKDTQTYNELLTTTTEKIKKVQAAMSSGAYAKYARDAARINAEQAKLAKTARAIDLRANFGNFTAGLIEAKERMSGLTTTAKVGLGLVTGSTMAWVTAGMAGTVEAYRLQQGFSRLSRSVASIFKPTIDAAGNSVNKLANWFQGLTREQQDSNRISTEWVAGILAGVVGVNALAGAVTRLAVLMCSMPLLGLGGGSAGGFAMGNQADCGRSDRRGGRRASRLGNFAKGGLIAGAGLYALDELTKDESGMGIVGKGLTNTHLGLKTAWRHTIGAFWMDDNDRRQEYLKDLRTRAQMGKIGGRDTMSAEDKVEWAKMQGNESNDAQAEAKKKQDKDRHDLTLNQTGFGEIGSDWDRLAMGVLRESAANSQGDGSDKIVAAIEKQTEEIKQKSTSRKRWRYMTYSCEAAARSTGSVMKNTGKNTAGRRE